MVASTLAGYPNAPGPDPRVASLADALYRTAYCRIDRRTPPPDGQTDLLVRLRAAHGRRPDGSSVDPDDGWNEGWSIVAREPNGLLGVTRGDARRVERPDDLRAADAHAVPAATPGTPVAIRHPREDAATQPGFYYAIGTTLDDRCDDHLRARFYLDLRADAAVQWMNVLTTTLDRHGVPYRFKVLRHAPAYLRVDAGILYVPRRHAAFVASVMVDLARSLGGLDGRTPLFTQRLAAGVGFADDPPGGGSFGLDRMTRVARALVDAEAAGVRGVAARRRAIEARFHADGLDATRPWLNPGNAPISPAISRGSRPVAGFAASARFPSSSASSNAWLAVADRIGAALVRDAIHDRGRCTWTGWAMVGHGPAARAGIATAGGDLYAGTAGIALFLARLSTATGDPLQRAVARAALLHARDHVHGIGAYTGLGGLLHATRSVARTCGADIRAATRPIVDAMRRARPGSLDVDLLAGRAGAIRALLEHVRDNADPDGRALEAATRFGRELVGLARRGPRGWSWRTPASGARGDLLGLSHGTSGIAGAFDDLTRATGDAAFREAAAAAWRRERAGFDATERNWPDLRDPPENPPTPGLPPPFNAWWCHGAPGTALALARHIAGRPRPLSPLRGLLSAAANTTAAALASRAPDGRPALASFCLCHGRAGNADVLMQIAALSGDTAIPPAVLDVARDGAARHAVNGDWPCGIPGGHAAPGLLTGLAGIGYFYLRLHDPALPSPLAL